jgi:hypothetical protein
VSWLDNVALHELGTAQPQLVYSTMRIFILPHNAHRHIKCMVVWLMNKNILGSAHLDIVSKIISRLAKE